MIALWLHLLLLVAWMLPAAAGERPSWAIINSANQLIAEHALFMPAGDGFLKAPHDNFIQYHLPEKRYTKQNRSWRVELLSKRWRKYQPGGWGSWNDAQPKHSTWIIGVIEVDVLTSGVRAR